MALEQRKTISELPAGAAAADAADLIAAMQGGQTVKKPIGDYLSIAEAVAQAALTAALLDYLRKDGGTMTGLLTLSGDPVNPLHATSKQYVDAAINALVNAAPDQLNTLNELAAALGDDQNFAATMTAALAGKLALAGGTMTGPLLLAGDPTADEEAARKKYVDDAVAANLTRRSVVTVATAPNNTVGAGVTVYLGSTGSMAAADTMVVIAPFAGTLKNLYTRASALAGAGSTFVYTVLVNGVATALTTTATNASQNSSDTANSVVVNAGERIQVKLVTSASAATATHCASIELDAA